MEFLFSFFKEPKVYVTVSEYLKGREVKYPLGWKLTSNMKVLLKKINILRGKYGLPFIVNSGYRPGHYNRDAGGSIKSAHITCEAIDLQDRDLKLSTWLLNNRNLLEELDLYMEDPKYTKSWVHLQTRPTKSGNRVFIP